LAVSNIIIFVTSDLLRNNKDVNEHDRLSNFTLYDNTGFVWVYSG